LLALRSLPFIAAMITQSSSEDNER
jgi:hypothetical protein